MAQHTTPVIEVEQQARSFYLTKLPAAVLCEISYASVRNRDNEQGAVQRLLEPQRIKDIRAFIIHGGDHPACIILNWVSTDHPMNVSDGQMTFEVTSRLAQLVDGQHRVEGLRASIKEKKSLEKLEIPVAIYNGLTTSQCADIFISINDKQKPVPKSLVVDLYQVASDYVVDAVAQRARDIADYLNTDESSPYHGFIKFPNDPRTVFGIPLSTVVSNIKPLVEAGGLFETVGLVELQMQKSCIANFFSVLKEWHGKRWDEKSNVFLSSAGFTGAIDFLTFAMIPYCNLENDFTAEHMKKAVDTQSQVIDKEEIKGLQGRAAWTKVQQLLQARFKTPGAKQKIKV